MDRVAVQSEDKRRLRRNNNFHLSPFNARADILSRTHLRCTFNALKAFSQSWLRRKIINFIWVGRLLRHLFCANPIRYFQKEIIWRSRHKESLYLINRALKHQNVTIFVVRLASRNCINKHNSVDRIAMQSTVECDLTARWVAAEQQFSPGHSNGKGFCTSPSIFTGYRQFSCANSRNRLGN